MIRAYSKRLLSPYTGQVQIVETTQARALTLDGRNWEIQFMHKQETGQPREQRREGTVLRHNWIRVATITDSEIERFLLPAFLDLGEIDERIVELSEYLSDIKLPLPAVDEYEYWLLDYEDESPLALIFSCTRADEISVFPCRPEWTALSAARMEIKATPDEQRDSVPPVNYRLEQLVTERAGRKARAVWFKRRPSETEKFPPCLVSENWEEEEHNELCQRYIQRQAPRLLMLHGLDHANRLRLEQAARDNALEVERFYPLYPEIANQKLMAAIRVEARLRRAAQTGTS